MASIPREGTSVSIERNEASGASAGSIGARTKQNWEFYVYAGQAAEFLKLCRRKVLQMAGKALSRLTLK